MRLDKIFGKISEKVYGFRLGWNIALKVKSYGTIVTGLRILKKKWLAG